MRRINFQGFTLLEVLISLVLLSFILLGFDEMEIYSLRSISAAYYFHIATEQLNSMIERLHTAGINFSVNEQIDIWNSQNKQLLPTGEGEITGSYPNYTITLYWGDTPHICQEIHLGQSGCIQRSITL